MDGDHGRIRDQDKLTVIHDVAWLQKRHNWPGLNAVVVVESEREIGDKVERETRFYITSLVLLATMLAPTVRRHWAIENSLHWVLDMIFRDDEFRAANRSRSGQLLHHQAHGPEPDPDRAGKGVPAAQAQDRRMG